MEVSIALHIIGIAYWNVGMMVLTNLLRRAAVANGQDATLNLVSKKTAFGVVLPGLVLSIVTGLYQLVSMGMASYFSRGWFHGKLTLVMVLLGITIYCFLKLPRVATLSESMRATFLKLHIGSALIFIVVVFLTILGR